MSRWTKLKQNHLLMMVLCCILPLAIILLAIQYFGLSRNYAWWAVLLLCPLTHYFMMRNMHKGHDNSSTNSDNNSESQTGGDETMESGKKKKGSCH